MDENWSAAAADVSAALLEVGFAATLTRPAPPPATPWSAPTGDAETFEITVSLGSVSTKYSRSDDGALIPRTVQDALVSVAGEAPAMGDTISIGGGDREVKTVAPTYGAETVIVYKIELAI